MLENNGLLIREATKNDVEIIRSLVHEIYPATYEKILSTKQLEYMLALFYSVSSLQKQFDDKHHFLIVEEDKKPVAFADYSLLKDGVYKLNKIYALPTQQGKGIGRLLINFIIQKIKKDAIALLLNVNRNNKAKLFYEHLGFTIIREEDIDIGEGYFMNDYVMEMKL